MGAVFSELNSSVPISNADFVVDDAFLRSPPSPIVDSVSVSVSVCALAAGSDAWATLRAILNSVVSTSSSTLLIKAAVSNHCSRVRTLPDLAVWKTVPIR